MRPYLTGTPARPETRGNLRVASAPQLTREPETCAQTTHLNSFGGRENYKFDHLDKTKDYPPLPPAKSRPALPPVVIEAHSRKPSYLPAEPNRLTRMAIYRAYRAYRVHISPKQLPLISRTIFVGRLRPRKPSRQQLEHVPGGGNYLKILRAFILSRSIGYLGGGRNGV
jgi:hypothetical protein